MRIFFPNGTIAYPPSKGTDVHKFQLTKNLRELGYEFTTFARDQNPDVDHIPKRPISVLRATRNSDVIYARTGEGISHATRLTSPLFRTLIPHKTAVIWEMNLGVNLKVRRKPRTDREVSRDLQTLQSQAERVDAAICVSQSIADQARELLGIEHVYTIQNGSDPEMFRPDLPRMAFAQDDSAPDTINIAWIASEENAIHDAKLVVELAQLIELRRLPFKIHAMGETERLFPSPAPASVTIHGPVSYLELPRYLASMDAGLVLYNLRYDGGSPLKLFDYCASGCIPFCSPGQAIEEVLANSGAGYVQWWTAESLCDALEELRNDRVKFKNMSTKARELVENQYNWRSIASRTDDIIRESVSRRSKITIT